MAKDYSDVGLNSRLQRVDSPASRARGPVSTIDFDAKTERGAITRSGVATIAQTFFPFDTVAGSSGGTITGTAYEDLPGATLTTPSFSGTATIMMFYTINFVIRKWSAGTEDSHAAGLVRWVVDGGVPSQSIAIQRAMVDGTSEEIQNRFTPVTTHHITTLGLGTHTVKMQARVHNYSGSAELVYYANRLSYIVLGK